MSTPSSDDENLELVMTHAGVLAGHKTILRGLEERGWLTPELKVAVDDLLTLHERILDESRTMDQSLVKEKFEGEWKPAIDRQMAVIYQETEKAKANAEGSD